MSDKLQDKIAILNQQIHIQAKSVEKDSLTALFFEQIPFLSRLAKTLDKVGLVGAKAAVVSKSSASGLKAVKGLQISGAAIAGVNFFTIPLAWLACKALGKPFPYSFSKGVKFSYATIVLALTIASLLVSPAIALFLSITLASLSVVSSISTLGQHFWIRRKLTQKLDIVNSKIEQLSTELKSIKQPIASNEDYENNQAYTAEINTRFNNHQQKIEELQDLLNQKEYLIEKKKVLGNTALIDKLIGFNLASLALAGLVTALFIPPVGMIILASCILASFGYVAGRIGFAVFSPKEKKQLPTSLTISSASNELILHNAISNDIQLDSTRKIASGFAKSPDKISKGLQSFVDNIHQVIEKQTIAQEFIWQINRDKNPKLALEFLYRVAENIMEGRFNRDQIKEFLFELDDFEQTIAVITHALEQWQNNELNFDKDKVALFMKLPVIEKYLAQHPAQTDVNKSDLQSEFLKPENYLLVL